MAEKKGGNRSYGVGALADGLGKEEKGDGGFETFAG